MIESTKPNIDFAARDTAFLTMSAPQNANLAVGDHVEFNLVEGNIPLSVGAGQANGVLTLTNSKKYKLEANVSCAFGATNDSCSFVWYDTTNNTEIGKRSDCFSVSGSATESSVSTVRAVVTPGADINVELRIIAVSGTVTLISNSFANGWVESLEAYINVVPTFDVHVPTIEYDTFTVGIHDSTNWSGSAFDSLADRQAADINRNFSNYTQCFWRLYEREVGTNLLVNYWEGLQFASIAALYTFIRNNCVESGTAPGTPANDIIATAYDIIDDTVQRVNRIYGLNTFLAILKGRRRYLSSNFDECVLDENLCSWGQLGNWIDDLNANAPGWLNPLSSWAPGSNEENIVWFSRNIKKLYGLPNISTVFMNLTALTNRRVWDWGASAVVAAPLGGYQGTGPSGEPKIYCSLDMPTQTWTFFDTTLRDHYVQQFNGDKSIIVLYQLSSTADPNKRAVLAKPLGIDRVSIPWFDSSVYDLYALYNRKNQTHNIRGPLTSTFEDVIANKKWVLKDQWMHPSKFDTKASARMVGTQEYTTRFFLRHKSTGRISKPSSARIVCAQRHRDAMFKFEVR